LTTPSTQPLVRARKHNSQDLAAIYDRHAGAIYRYLYRYLGDAAQAEDLTAEVFLKLLQVLDTPRAPREQLAGWLYRVAHNLAMDWFRRKAKVRNLPLNEDLVADSDSPAASLEKRQARQQLRLAILRLTADQQRVILLRFGEGFKLKEVARLMGKSEGAVKILQHRAVKRLQKLLAQEEKRIHEQARS
jgi:RNA polymerase sigma-70 factor (ECF subfamily)